MCVKAARRPKPPEISSATVTDVHQDAGSHQEANQKDLLWQRARLQKEHDAEQSIDQYGPDSIPSCPRRTVVPPTDLSTIHTILCKLVDVCEHIVRKSTPW